MKFTFTTLKFYAALLSIGLCLQPRLAQAEAATTRLIMTGDILLSREVEREIKLKHAQSPWQSMQHFFTGADWVMGNFEASVGEQRNCPEKDSLCFAVSPEALTYPKNAGFTALGIENNHSADSGAEARTRTRSALLMAGISAIDYEHSPGFFKSQNNIFAFIALSNVPARDGFKIDIPSPELRQKIRLAKSLSDWVIVNVHWGAELTDWPQPKQRAMAAWLIAQGADVIIGHHPHVVQPPECIHGKPVFFSLGNHLFDQKYPQTKQGLIADCKADANQLFCTGIATETPANSAFPSLTETIATTSAAIETCRVNKTEAIVIDGYKIRPRLNEHQFMDGEIILEGTKPDYKNWAVVAKRLLAVEKARFTHGKMQQDFLVTLETHHSSIDQEVGPRPYVYQVTPHRLVAKWRGSALAWPLVDVALIHSPSGDSTTYLCALHRKDSFVTLNPNTKATRTAVYTWNGFGFSGIEDATLNTECDQVFN